MTDFEGESPFNCGDEWTAIDVDALKPKVKQAVRRERRLLQEAHADDEVKPIYDNRDAILSLLDQVVERRDVA